MDARVRPFLVCVKAWARARGVCDSLHAGLSAYSLTLMALHFLQRYGREIDRQIER